MATKKAPKPEPFAVEQYLGDIQLADGKTVLRRDVDYRQAPSKFVRLLNAAAEAWFQARVRPVIQKLRELQTTTAGLGTKSVFGEPVLVGAACCPAPKPQKPAIITTPFPTAADIRRELGLTKTQEARVEKMLDKVLKDGGWPVRVHTKAKARRTK